MSLAASLALVAAVAIGSAIAGVTSSSTTTTVFGGTTTTTMFVPEDVTGGGTFEGSFPKFSFDAYSFTLDEPRVVVAEITNGFGGCPGDSIVELRQPGAPGNCNGEYGDDLPCIAMDDDSGISLCSKLVHYIAEPGDYELRVTAYRNGQLPRYFIHVEFVEIECGNGVLELTEGCDDGNNSSGDCCSPTCAKDAAGSSCNDNVFCNGADTCNASAVCANHAGDPCPGPDGDGNCSETCNEIADACNGPDPNETACQDGLFCNGIDKCSGGACSVHAGDPCPGPDGDGNCAERCNEGTDACTLADPNGAACNDGVFCNGADTCSAGACSQHTGNPCSGADGDVDCSETCDETADACTGNDPDGSACQDNLFCNGADSCAGGLCSEHGGTACPGVDNDANCAESCSDSAAGCTGNDPNGAPCDDGIFCNGADSCLGGACSQHAGNPCPGPDGDGNCAESCSEANDTCTAPDTNGSACSDGTFCNGNDTCSAGACTGHAGNPCPGPDGDGNCAESCDESADACTAADLEGSVCADGLFCNGPDTCQSGFCTQHAGDPCPGADGDSDCSETCSEAADACSGNDPNGSDCSDSLYCNGTDSCSAGACSVHTGDPCPGADGDIDCSETCNEASDSCTANDPNNAACNDFEFCNGSDKCQSGGCTVHVGDPCAAPDGDANCSESCDETTETCTGPDPNGSPCTDNLFCTGSDTCSGGSCSIHLGSPCPGADGDAGCAESCNEGNDSCNAPDPDGSPCVDDVYCNGTDKCLSGVCSVHTGDPCTGPDGDGNCAESCSEAGDTCTAADPGGSACDDGLFCNGADTCAGGACSGHAGSPCPGPDGDANCMEACSENADACSAAESDGAPCDDGVFCNGADTCLAGACSQHAGNPCAGADGDGNCSETCNETSDACSAADPNGSACNDGLFCNGADSCSGGSCSVHAGTPCAPPDGDGNCSESCNEATDACTAPDPNASACNDGLFCNGADTCQSGACSLHAGNPCPGIDGDLDCSETCDETADACTGNDPNGSACQDGLACNDADSCINGLCNDHENSVCPGADGDADCSESCSDTSGGCTGNDPVGSPCDDGIFCNGPDSCLNGACSVHAGNPCAGPDGDADCSETCDEAADACSANDPGGSACDDGVFCNGADTCAAGACTGHAGDPCPGPDGDGNCAESCSEGAGTCTAPDGDGGACNDGLFCNGPDTCAAGFCTGHAGDPCPGADGDMDCSETCDEAADACSANDPNGAACSDGAFCNGADTCAAGGCTQHSGSPCPGPDGDANCSESCNESGDTCTSADQNGSACNDALYCNGSDTCASGACTGLGASPCADGDPCTLDTCSEASDTCSNTPVEPCTTTTTTVPETLCGDVNGDDSLKASDALLVLRAAVGGNQCASKPCVCDANGNGILQASDALLVLRGAVGAPANLVCPC